MKNENDMNEKEITIWESIIPIILLVGLLAYNISVYGDSATSGSNQFILLVGAAIAALVGFKNKVSYKKMIEKISSNIKSTTEALLILLFIGALTGTWLVSGIIPTLVYGGLKLINPTIFLPLTVIICSLVSIATGSSWTTSATVGVAFIALGKAIGLPVGMVAGAVISGAYFGDKMSPLSDTTNLAPAMAGAELFSHIKYMTNTTFPSYVVTLVVFIILGFAQSSEGITDAGQLLIPLSESFNISGWLMLVPIILIALIIMKTRPLIALISGAVLGGIFAIIFQPEILIRIADADSLTFTVAYKGVINAMTVETVVTENSALSDLQESGGMFGMLDTIWLIICAMAFGGVMDAIGALKKISSTLLNMANSMFGLFGSTVASCIVMNITASDQYLAIVVPGKMFAKAYEDKGLAPENLSRTLEDSGTVTSVLVPWNTCGAYQSGVLNVRVEEYFIYAVFNYVSPIMTLIFAALKIRIKMLTNNNNNSN